MRNRELTAEPAHLGVDETPTEPYVDEMQRIAGAFVFVALVFLLGPSTRAQRFDLLDHGETWRYFKGVTGPSNVPDAWYQPAFDDSDWASGDSGIGYGDLDDATVLEDMEGTYLTVYARRRFVVGNLRGIVGLVLEIAVDDGFVAYLNGSEVARLGLGSGAPQFDSEADGHEADHLDTFDLSGHIDLLVPGENVLAFEVHNESLTSSDLSFLPRLYRQGSNPVSRGPFLQQSGTSSIAIAWRTESSASGEVRYGRDEPTLSATQTGTHQDHLVTVTGLEPGTEYVYQIGENGRPMSEVRTFRTTPAAWDTRFRVAALGDSGVGDQDQANVARLLENLRPDLILHTGDVVYNNGEALNYDPHFFTPYRRLIDSAVLWPTLGNHDWRTGNGAPFEDAFYLPANNPEGSEHYYSFVVADTLFVAVDSEPLPRIGQPQYQWLEATLAASTECFKVVFLHHPPYCSGDTHGSDVATRNNLSPLFDLYGVDLVLAGHEHIYERSNPVLAGTVMAAEQEPDYVSPGAPIYIVTGGGGRDLYGAGADYWTASSESIFHAVVLDRDGDSWLLRAIGVDGTQSGIEIDRMTLRRPECATDFSVYRSPDRDDVLSSPLAATTQRSYLDNATPPPGGTFFYQVGPAAVLSLEFDDTGTWLRW